MGEKIHSWLAVAAFAIALIGFLGWRSLGTADSRRVGPSTTPVPSSQVSQVMMYSAPLLDSVRYVATASDSIALPTDPFAPQPVPRVAQVRSALGESEQPIAVDEPHWRVTATLMAGSRSAAVINDALIYVGDPLPGGGKLKSVERDRVILTDKQGISHTVVVKEGDT
jgi:hypothetical protein